MGMEFESLQQLPEGEVRQLSQSWDNEQLHWFCQLWRQNVLTQ